LYWTPATNIKRNHIVTPDSHYQTNAGRERFSLAFIAASVAMASVTYGIGRYAYGLFLPEIRRDFALDTFTLGLIASAGTVDYLLSNIVASAIAIHFKPRTFIVIGGAVTTLGLALVGIATNAPTAVGEFCWQARGPESTRRLSLRQSKHGSCHHGKAGPWVPLMQEPHQAKS
jgi:MFS family permease